MTERIDTLVIGAGQSGLTISSLLSQQGREHIVLEKRRIGEAWRSEKWDSFTLVTPNWQLRLPGHKYQGDDPEGFLTRQEVVEYLEDYVEKTNPPVRAGVEVTGVMENPAGEGFRVETSVGPFEASNVVVAAGTFQKPNIPSFSRKLAPDVVQLHSSRYTNPDDLPEGAVLVVGSGQSGCQITEELHQNGREVTLATGSATRLPRRYRGKDTFDWLVKMGFVDRTVDQLDSLEERFDANPHVTGKDGGHTLNLHQFARDGVTLLGRLEDAQGNMVYAAGDLQENLTRADKFANQVTQGIDKFIEKAGIEAPEDGRKELDDGYQAEEIRELDLEEAGITTVIWATGYSFDFSWIDFPVFDEFGYPVQEQGVTKVPGLYFLGLHWLHTLKSGLFLGVGEDAANIAEHIAEREKQAVSA